MSGGDQELGDLLREAIPPVQRQAPGIDLWPHLERRLHERRARLARSDWLVAALVLGLLALFPEAALLVLYHL